MDSCCGEDAGTTSKQIAIILVIICVCVVIAIGLLFANARNEFEEIQNFHFGFEGRKMFIKERRMVYRSSIQQVRRYTKVGLNSSELLLKMFSF